MNPTMHDNVLTQIETLREMLKNEVTALNDRIDDAMGVKGSPSLLIKPSLSDYNPTRHAEQLEKSVLMPLYCIGRIARERLLTIADELDGAS